MSERERAIALLRAWVAGCGDEHFSTKDECRELLQRSGDFLASLSVPESPDASPTLAEHLLKEYWIELKDGQVLRARVPPGYLK